MRLAFHPRVYADLAEIMAYYERVGAPELADAFYLEFRYYVEQVAESPLAFAVRERDLRRADLRRFPYHFLFRIAGESVRILVVRHHRRRPSVGMQRR
jgi:plasmid stabilization system protein ParE